VLLCCLHSSHVPCGPQRYGALGTSGRDRADLIEDDSGAAARQYLDSTAVLQSRWTPPSMPMLQGILYSSGTYRAYYVHLHCFITARLTLVLHSKGGDRLSADLNLTIPPRQAFGFLNTLQRLAIISTSPSDGRFLHKAERTGKQINTRQVTGQRASTRE